MNSAFNGLGASGSAVPNTYTQNGQIKYSFAQPTNVVMTLHPNMWRSGAVCETASIQETHTSPNRDVPPEQRLVTAFNVTVLSFALAADGAKTVFDRGQAATEAASKSAEQNAKKQQGPVL
jgi:hypothetical protein